MAIGNIERRVEGDLPTTEQAFIENAENHIPKQLNPFSADALKDLSEDELVQRYKDIDQQSQLFKGQILLEMRSRFTSNIEFGQWCSVNFTERDSSNTGKLINLAKFFQGTRSLDGIPISAAYLIAAPGNKEISQKVYSNVSGKNLKLNEIKGMISRYKDNPNTKVLEIDENKVRQIEQGITTLLELLLNKVFVGKDKEFIISILQGALKKLKSSKQ